MLKILTEEQFDVFLESKEVKNWHKSLEALLDHIIDLIDKKVAPEKKNEIQTEIINNMFASSIRLHNGIERVKNETE